MSSVFFFFLFSLPSIEPHNTKMAKIKTRFSPQPPPFSASQYPDDTADHDSSFAIEALCLGSSRRR